MSKRSITFKRQIIFTKTKVSNKHITYKRVLDKPLIQEFLFDNLIITDIGLLLKPPSKL